MGTPKLSVPQWVGIALTSFIGGLVASSVATRFVVPPIAWPACENARFLFEVINGDEDANGQWRLRRGVRILDKSDCRKVVDRTVTDLFFPTGTILWASIIAFAQVRKANKEPRHQDEP